MCPCGDLTCVGKVNGAAQGRTGDDSHLRAVSACAVYPTCRSDRLARTINALTSSAPSHENSTDSSASHFPSPPTTQDKPTTSHKPCHKATATRQRHPFTTQPGTSNRRHTCRSRRFNSRRPCTSSSSRSRRSMGTRSRRKRRHRRMRRSLRFTTILRHLGLSGARLVRHCVT